MATSARRLLALYLAGMFATLPVLPTVVEAVRARLGAGSVQSLLHLFIALCLLLPAVRLFFPSRSDPPWPHLSYVGLVGAALLVVRTLASSPIGRVHLVEYALLAILVLRALPAATGRARHAAAFALASLVGLADELVQLFLPNRVFDLYDVGLNSAAAALGVLTFAWWRWTAPDAGARTPGRLDSPAPW